MPFSVSQANAFLNFMFSKTNAALTPPTYIYMGLSKNDPEADNGTFTELSGDTYARVLISQKGETYPDVIGPANGRTIKNVKQINFNRSTVAWDTIHGFGLFTTETGGTPFYYAKVDSETGVEVPPNAVALFDPETLSISFASTDV